MEESLFIEWVNKYFKGITIRVVETLNGDDAPRTYLHRELLKKDFSVTGKWETLIGEHQLVAADFVAMDSSLPLKSRGSLGKASGDIPKQGIEFTLNEKQLSELDALVAQGGSKEQIVAKLFADTPKAIGGVYEKNEFAFLQGLSTGITLVEDPNNVGTGVRLDFGYPSSNKFNMPQITEDLNVDQFLQPLLDKASTDGNSPSVAYTDPATINALRSTDWAKQLFVTGGGVAVMGADSKLPRPSLSKLNEVLQDEYGFVFRPINRSVRLQKDGVNTDVKPWAPGAIVFTDAGVVGSLAYARLAEQNHPVAGVSYQLVDDYILASKFRTNRPSLKEFTTAQARSIPVISNVDRIYLLNVAQAPPTT